MLWSTVAEMKGVWRKNQHNMTAGLQVLQWPILLQFELEPSGEAGNVAKARFAVGPSPVGGRRHSSVQPVQGERPVRTGEAALLSEH